MDVGREPWRKWTETGNQWGGEPGKVKARIESKKGRNFNKTRRVVQEAMGRGGRQDVRVRKPGT